eukprot:CAMPEP_0206488240 /NCGR_PEP_ID=MMETSP0324_2-20121206/42261_1 /ASSEMBLY_ACC=CAM_ASM_000836 /TAXON_ID=2866 /ORGANISM="Crypthecodinium cohnii, Strain Seligo" /LENGTH=30 /DNA_ID= /DNA_START= /DNA_END= /DNA_ORIENTATION=
MRELASEAAACAVLNAAVDPPLTGPGEAEA